VKRVFIGLFMVVAIIGLAFAGCAQPAPAPAPAPAPVAVEGPPTEVTEWVFQPCFDSSDAGWPCGLVPWVEDVEAATQGTVSIDLLPVGSITSSDEAFGAAAGGTTDVYAGWATVYSGDLPEGMHAYGNAFGCANAAEGWAWMKGDPKYNVYDIVEAGANKVNMHWAGWCSQGPNAAFTTWDVNKWEDFEGKKMRAGGPQALFLSAMGGVPVAMPGGEIYMAIKLGTIEGTFWDTGGTDDMKFYEVIDRAIQPGWCPNQCQEIYVNLDSWNALTQWQRDRIDEVFMTNYFKASRMHYIGVLEALKAIEDYGGKVIYLSGDEITRMTERCVEKVYPQVAALSAGAAQGIELQKQFLEDVGRL